MAAEAEPLRRIAVQQLREAGFIVELDAGVKSNRVDIVAYSADDAGEARPDLVVEVGENDREVLAQLSRAAVSCGARRAYVFDGEWWQADAAFVRLEPSAPPLPRHIAGIPRVGEDQIRRYLSVWIRKLAEGSSRSIEPIGMARRVLDHIRATGHGDDLAALLREPTNALTTVRVLVTLVSQMSRTGALGLPLEVTDALVKLLALSPGRAWRVMDPSPDGGSCLFAVHDYCRRRGISVTTHALDLRFLITTSSSLNPPRANLSVAGRHRRVPPRHSNLLRSEEADDVTVGPELRDAMLPATSSAPLYDIPSTREGGAEQSDVQWQFLTTLADFAGVLSDVSVQIPDRETTFDATIAVLPAGIRSAGSSLFEEASIKAVMERVVVGGRGVFLTTASLLSSERLRRARQELMTHFRVVAAIEIENVRGANVSVPLAVIVLERSGPTETLLATFDGEWTKHFTDDAQFLADYRVHLNAK